MLGLFKCLREILIDFEILVDGNTCTCSRRHNIQTIKPERGAFFEYLNDVMLASCTYRDKLTTRYLWPALAVAPARIRTQPRHARQLVDLLRK